MDVRHAATVALQNALTFAHNNFSNDSERNYIMQIICEGTLAGEAAPRAGPPRAVGCLRCGAGGQDSCTVATGGVWDLTRCACAPMAVKHVHSGELLAGIPLCSQ